jgi:MFS family permease
MFPRTRPQSRAKPCFQKETQPISQPQLDDMAKLRALPWSLAHTALNSLFYTWTFGSSIFILFLNELGLPKDRIGVLLSFFPFTGLLALAAGPLAARWGRKRVFMLCYGVRKPVMASLLLLPWLLAHLGRSTALTFLFGILFIFAVLRAVAETAYFPWLQEFVPNRVRGKYAGANTITSLLFSALALGVASLVIAKAPGLGAFMGLIGVGAVVGVIGVAVMACVPGGAPVGAAGAAEGHLVALGLALRDRNFLYYLGGLGCVMVGSVMLTGFLPLYVIEQIGLSSSSVVLFDMAAMLGGVAASLFWGVAADRLGSRPVLIPSLILNVLIPVGWLVALRQAANAALVCALLFFAYGVVANGLSISASRLLFNAVIPVEKNTSYTAVYYAWSGLSGGITPLLAGAMLTKLAGWQAQLGFLVLDAYRLLFLLSAGLFVGGLYLYGRVRPDGESTRAVFRRLSTRFQARSLPVELQDAPDRQQVQRQEKYQEETHLHHPAGSLPPQQGAEKFQPAGGEQEHGRDDGREGITRGRD